MDDDDLTQDILDQFDLICTQHQTVQVDCEKSLIKPTIGKQCDLPTSCALPSLVVEKDNTMVLERSTSLGSCMDAKENQTYRSPGVALTSLEREEVEQLKKEVSVLREELYMKLGELATLKESSNRSNAAKTDIIQRLETHLTSERNEFQRKLSELNAQIAFREADYRLVCTELIRVKEQFNCSKTLPENSVNYSPASQIMATMVASPQSDQTHSTRKGFTPSRAPPPDFHLPSPITPVTSRKTPNYANGIWSVTLPNAVEIKRSGESDQPVVSPTCSRSNQNPISRPNRREFSPPDETNQSETLRKRRRRHTMADETGVTDSPKFQVQSITFVKSFSDAAVETSDTLDTSFRHRGLSHRINLGHSDWGISSVLEMTESLPNTVALVSDLLDATISESPGKMTNVLPTNLPITSNQIFDSIWKMDNCFMLGIRNLIEMRTSMGDEIIRSSNPIRTKRSIHVAELVERLSVTLPYVIKKLEDQISVCILKVPDGTLELMSVETNLQLNGEDEAKENEDPSKVFEPDGNEISYLDEDPFAGAPASQIVTSYSHSSSFDSRLIQSHKRPMLTKNKSCPSTVNLARPVSPKTNQFTKSSKHKSDYEYLVEQAVCAIGKLHRLAELLTSCWLVYCESIIHSETDNKTRYDSNLVRRKIQDMLLCLVGIVSRLLKRVAETHLLFHSSNQFPDGKILNCRTTITTVQQSHHRQLLQYVTDHFLPSMSLLNCTPLILSSQPNHSSSSLLWIPPQVITLSMNLSAYLANWIDQSLVDHNHTDNTNQFSEHDYRVQLDCAPDQISCVISASEACFGSFNPQITNLSKPMHCDYGLYSELGSNQASNYHRYSNLTSLAPLTALFHLWQTMISSGHWPIGHCSSSDNLSWSINQFRLNPDQNYKNDFYLNQDSLLSYLRLMFGISVRCSLHGILVWMDRISDYLVHKHRNFDQTNWSQLQSDTDQPNSGRCYCCWNSEAAELLYEFSGFVAALARSDQISWSDSCPCKSQIYSTLVNLANIPFQELLTMPSTLSIYESTNTDHQTIMLSLLNQQKCLISAFGQFTRALIALLWRHGDSAFQLYTDCLPAYFYLIANLSLWTQRSKMLGLRTPHEHLRQQTKLESGDQLNLRPELVEELYDFDPGSEFGPSSSTA